MSGLVDKRGNPLRSSDYQNKKAAPPALGEKFGRWAGEDAQFITRFPGGGAIAFDTSMLTLADFRQMTGHYQVNSSLSILTFMMHQMDWHIECERQGMADLVENQLRAVWSRLVRAQSQALWAGYGPNVLQWENDYVGREVVLTKIKDLVPEDSRVHWNEIENTVPGTNGGKYKFKVYGGIRQFGAPGPIPVENSYWYPLLMQNGNYYGKRLLESAFQPWFFSNLLHLFANRYHERYGEPTPVGRAPFEDTIDVNGQTFKGNQLMALIMQQLRNRSVVVLPNDRTQVSDGETNPQFDYQLEYMESQMRGADFERYMTRLDEEISLAMFTPILMMRTADVGSYNLGTQHTQVYQWMLNAIAEDWKYYIDKYIIRPIVAYNSPGRPVKAEIKFTKMGKTSSQLLQALLTSLMEKDKIKLDVRELGQMSGLSITEVNTVTDTAEPDAPEEEADPNEENRVASIKKLITKRVRAKVEKGFSTGEFGDNDFAINMGYKRQLAEALKKEGYSSPGRRVDDAYDAMDQWLGSTAAFGVEEYEQPEVYVKMFERRLDQALDAVA